MLKKNKSAIQKHLSIHANPEYLVFRLERVKTGGGGLALGVLSDLKPVLVNEGDDESEAITVVVEVKQLKIRIFVGYGASDSDQQAKKLDITPKERKENLWNYLESEVIEAEKNNECLIIQIDANAYLGSKLLKNDPNDQNPNGELFAAFLVRNPAIIVVNNLNLCKGVITRKRITINTTEALKTKGQILGR